MSDAAAAKAWEAHTAAMRAAHPWIQGAIEGRGNFIEGFKAGAEWARKEAAARKRAAANLSDFGADAQTAEERRILSERWEREHPGVDSSASRLRAEGKHDV